MDLFLSSSGSKLVAAIVIDRGTTKANAWSGFIDRLFATRGE